MKNICVIPARGGSKGIPCKAIKHFRGKPLISYAVESAINSGVFDNIYISTESSEIATVVKSMFGDQVTVLSRPIQLANDTATIDDVIFYVVKQLALDSQDFVFTIQATSPLLTSDTIRHFFKEFKKSARTSAQTVVNDTHLRWKKHNDTYMPLYKKRVNRQLLPEEYKETGGIIACKAGYLLKNKTRISKDIQLIEISSIEGIDIDSYNDWAVAIALMDRPKVGIVVIGDQAHGMGHVYRGLLLAEFLNYEVEFFYKNHNTDHSLLYKIKNKNYKVTEFKSDKDLLKKVTNKKIKIIINDCLDTKKTYISMLKATGLFVVNFEDIGSGSEEADIVINALYESRVDNSNRYSGYRYADMRQEFLLEKPKNTRKKVEQVLMTFGGGDENNITGFVSRLLIDKFPNIKFNIVLGLAYQNYDEINKEFGNKNNVNILKDVTNMAELMNRSDIIITSNGRTLYEAVCMGTPVISISQNLREISHTFAEKSKNIFNLGLVESVNEKKMLDVFKKLIDSYELRKSIREEYLSLNISSGTERIIKIIERGYDDWSRDKNRL